MLRSAVRAGMLLLVGLDSCASPTSGRLANGNGLPAVTSRATSASRRLEERAARYSRSNAARVSSRSRPISIPLACSISHRCSRARLQLVGEAVLNWVVTAAARRLAHHAGIGLGRMSHR